MTSASRAPILIAYDSSVSARKAISEAAALFSPGPVIVVTVWEPGLAYASAATTPGIGVKESPGSFDFEAGRQIEKASEDHAERIAHEGAEIARAAGMEAQSEAIPDATATGEAIAGRARELNAAAIVAGSSGLSGIRARLEGSTARAIFKHSPCPVLIVHAD